MDLEAFELVLLRRPASAPDYPEAELDRIQREHLAHHARLRDSGQVGGRQARRATSGLCRVLPLNYAGPGLTGMRREMARLRGADAADRHELARRAAAVLDRDPAAVTAVSARLVELRDAASSSLAFELAARLIEG